MEHFAVEKTNHSSIDSLMLDIFETGIRNFNFAEFRNSNSLEELLYKLYQQKVPSIELGDQAIKIDDVNHNLKHIPMIFRLFKLFIESEGKLINREYLALKIYREKFDSTMSERRRISLEHNVIKLVSRARGYANTHFTPNSPDLEWFYFENLNRSWSLIRRRII